MNHHRGTAGLAPYVWAIVAIVPAYAVTLSITQQQMLAVTFAAIAALVGFFGCRFVQLRGKLTLAMLVIALPLFVALVFTGLHMLRPFAHRGQSVRMLRDAQVNFQLRTATQLGEWKQDHSGNLLPTWLADMIGPDCLSELTSIGGEIEDIQSIRLDEIDRSNLKRIELKRVIGHTPPVSTGLTNWLNELDGPSIRIELANYADADGDAFELLNAEYRMLIGTVDYQTGDLSKLAAATKLTLQGQTLLPRHALELSKLTRTLIELDGLRLTPESAAAFGDLPPQNNGLYLQNTAVDAAALEALIQLPNQFLSFQNVTLAGMKPSAGQAIIQTASEGESPRIKLLSGLLDNLSLADVCRLLGQFPCRQLSLGFEATEDDRGILWKFKGLEQIYARKPGEIKKTLFVRGRGAQS